MQNLEHKAVLTERIIQVLKTIFDPEIPVNIYDLGLIYEISIDDNDVVTIRMTLTAPNCPIAEDLPVEVHDAIKATEGVTDCNVILTFDPPWDKDMISEAAMLDLGLL